MYEQAILFVRPLTFYGICDHSRSGKIPEPFFVCELIIPSASLKHVCFRGILKFMCWICVSDYT